MEQCFIIGCDQRVRYTFEKIVDTNEEELERHFCTRHGRDLLACDVDLEDTIVYDHIQVMWDDDEE